MKPPGRLSSEAEAGRERVNSDSIHLSAAGAAEPPRVNIYCHYFRRAAKFLDIGGILVSERDLEARAPPGRVFAHGQLSAKLLCQ